MHHAIHPHSHLSSSIRCSLQQTVCVIAFASILSNCSPASNQVGLYNIRFVFSIQASDKNQYVNLYSTYSLLSQSYHELQLPTACNRYRGEFQLECNDTPVLLIHLAAMPFFLLSLLFSGAPCLWSVVRCFSELILSSSVTVTS